MPNIQSQIKRDRQNKKRREANQKLRSSIKTITKKFNASIENKDFDKASQDRDLLFKTMDKAAKRNIVHKNFVANRKSRASLQLNGIKPEEKAAKKKADTKKD